MASTDLVWICSMAEEAEGKRRHVKPSLEKGVVSQSRSGSQSHRLLQSFLSTLKKLNHMAGGTDL